MPTKFVGTEKLGIQGIKFQYEAKNEMCNHNTTYKSAFIGRSVGGDSPNKAG
jgi:hypothetical protein